ncbi:uncharacterized protein BDV17DRAFT_249329 [Aspergillus undulatus]|uniref:uncharacterized protein n=1 Tax=Aspergillus undulatus TaxID=1810928 RepID=UPI003CCD1F18
MLWLLRIFIFLCDAKLRPRHLIPANESLVARWLGRVTEQPSQEPGLNSSPVEHSYRLRPNLIFKVPQASAA